MNKETFEIIKTNLEERIASCNEKLGNILTTDDLKNLTLGDAQALKNWAKREMSKMDRIIGPEFYHVIGMGELTILQTNTFIKLMKEYMTFRSDIKTIAMNFTLDTLPGLPSQSEYNLKELGNVTLKSKIRGRAEAASIIIENETTSAEQPSATLADSLDLAGFSMTGKTIFFPIEKLDMFIKLVNPQFKADKIKKAIKDEKEFADIKWSYLNKETGMVMGICTDGLGKYIKKLLKKHA